MQIVNYIVILPNIALLVCLVQDLLPSGKHVLQALVIDHAPNFIVAQGPCKDYLEHELSWCT